jgi:hypothetical protein
MNAFSAGACNSQWDRWQSGNSSTPSGSKLETPTLTVWKTQWSKLITLENTCFRHNSRETVYQLRSSPRHGGRATQKPWILAKSYWNLSNTWGLMTFLVLLHQSWEQNTDYSGVSRALWWVIFAA